MIITISGDINKIKMWFFTTKLLEEASHSLKSYPWRRDRTIYTVFVAEFFLQRTKVSQVKKIYKEFIDKFPSLEELIKFLDEERVIFSFLEKLGLNKRKKYFIETLKKIKNSNKLIEDFDFEDWIALPGIGQYTASAILCFGKNEKRPIVDSNVIRIFKRFFNLKSSVSVIRNDRKLWDFAEQLLPEENFVQFNYMLIDFGISICKLKKPLCDNCNLKEECSHFREQIK